MSLKGMGKETKAGGQLLWLMFILLGGFVLSIIVTMVVGLFGVDMLQTWPMLWMQGVSQLLTFFLATWVFAYCFHDSVKEYLCLDFGSRKWLLGLVALVVMLLLQPACDWLTRWNDAWHWGGAFASVEKILRDMGAASEGIVEQFMLLPGAGGLLANLLVVALIPAVCEELFFRGGVQQILQRWFKNPHVAIWVTAVVFSLFHLDLFAFLPRMVMGVVLGYLFYYSGSILVNACAHFANNALVVVLHWLYNNQTIGVSPADMPAMSWCVTLLCLAAASLLFAVYFVPKKDE